MVAPLFVAVLILANATFVLPIFVSAVVTKVTPEAVSITTVVISAPVKAVLSVPVVDRVLVALLILPRATVEPPITTSTPLTKVMLEEATDITTLVVDPLSAVFKVPVTAAVPDPCVTVTPTLSVIDCAVISKVHSFWKTVFPTLSVISCAAIFNVHSFDMVVFNIPVLDPCVTVAPAFSVIACAVISNFHSFFDPITKGRV